MQFLTVAVLATSVAAGLVERDADTANAIAKIISGIADQVNTVDAAAKAYTSGDPSKALEAAGPLEDAIKSGTTTVNGLKGSIAITDAATVAPPLTDKLAPAASALVKDLVAKREQVEAAGACAKVETVVKAVAADSDALIAAITGKVDEIAKPVAVSLAAAVQAPLSSAVAAFGTASCVNKGGATGGSSTGAGSSTAAPTSTGATTKVTSAAGTTTVAGTTVTSGATTVVVPTTVATTTSALPTGGSGSAPGTTPSAVPPPGNGAAAFAPAGALALALAAIAL